MGLSEALARTRRPLQPNTIAARVKIRTTAGLPSSARSKRPPKVLVGMIGDVISMANLQSHSLPKLTALAPRNMRKVLSALMLVCVVAGIGVAALYCYSVFFIDSTKELRRGHLIDELLLTSGPVRNFPEGVVSGTRRYFYTTGEPTGKSSNILRIDVGKVDSLMVDRSEEWLVKCGFKTVASDTARTQIKLVAKDGRAARISTEAAAITIQVEE